MAKRKLAGAILLTGLVVGVGGAGFTHAQFGEPGLVADATKQGHVDFYVGGERGRAMRVSEVGGGTTRLLGTVVLDERGFAVIRDGARWRCDRLSRRFLATGQVAGAPVSASYSVRTPSCRDRLDLRLQRRVRPGGNARIVVLDEWAIGDLRLRLC